MAVVTSAVIAGVGLVSSVAGSAVSANKAKKAGKKADRQAARKEAEIKVLEQNRQAIPNPYANFRDISYLAEDLSGNMTNPYDNLGVATQAAEFQAEQADMALASTLDTLRATGAGAGGATALAQAALQSKMGVSASIEQQESANEKLKAQGKAELQQAKIAEAQRLQGIQMGEAQRMQVAEAEGAKFKYGEQENRDVMKLNRLAGQEAQAQSNAVNSRNQEAAAWAGGVSAVGNVASGALGAAGTLGAAGYTWKGK